MTRTLGIIPAGGKARRFHGYPKELLPISRDDCGLTRTIRAMTNGGADEVLLITNRDKLGLHWGATGETKRVRFRCHECAGLWEAITLAWDLQPADWYYFAMPDTVFPIDAFQVRKAAPVMAGVFETDKPERFGVLRGGQIVDKQPGPKGRAWGIWIWSYDAMSSLVTALGLLQDHTEALNTLIARYGITTFPLNFYWDFATFDDYKGFLCSLM